MLSGYKQMPPIPMSSSKHFDRMAPANDPPLVRRFVNIGDVNRFQFVRAGGIEWIKDEQDYKYIVSDLNTTRFFCANDDSNESIYISWSGTEGHLCHDFAIEITDEIEGIEFFRLRSLLTGKYMRINPRTGAIYSHGNINEAAKFFLVDEQMVDFFVVQVYKTPYNSINEQGKIVPYQFQFKTSIPEEPEHFPTVLMGIPLADNNFTLDHLNFARYGETSQQSELTYPRANPAFFNLVYNPVKRTVALRFTNARHEIRWLCFVPIEGYMAERKERSRFICFK